MKSTSSTLPESWYSAYYIAQWDAQDPCLLVSCTTNCAESALLSGLTVSVEVEQGGVVLSGANDHYSLPLDTQPSQLTAHTLTVLCNIDAGALCYQETGICNSSHCLPQL